MEENLDIKDPFLREVIDIDPLQIDVHFRRVPAELAYYNEQYTVALGAYLIAKHKVDQTKAELYQHLSEDSVTNGKRKTVAALEADIEASDEYIAARQTLIACEVAKQEARGKISTVEAKKEMLISLGAHIRIELSDPIIRTERATKAMNELAG